MIYDKFGNPIKTNHRAVRSKTANTDSIIAKIVNMFKDRSRKDIDKWRNAISMAEHPKKPRRDFLYQLYNDLMTDGHLQNQISLRKSVVLNTTFQIISKSSGEINEELTDLFNSKWFYDLLEILSETPLYGHSLIEFTSFEDSNIEFSLVPRTNVVPEMQYVIPDLSRPDDVIPYNEPQHEAWIIEFGKKDLGILNNIVPNLIWKRNIMQSWAEFCEKFGLPMVTATSQKFDDGTLDTIEAMLEQLGEAAYAVFPQGTEIEFKEANSHDIYQVFDAKIERNNGEVSKAITGSTMLTDNGSSRSQSEVHERNLEERIAPADRRNIAFFVNHEVFNILRLHGYNIADDSEFVFDTTQTLDLDKHWEITKDLLNVFEIDENWIAKTFNVPITGKKLTALPPQEPNAKHDDSFFFENLTLPNYTNAHCAVCGGTLDDWQFSAELKNDKIKQLENQLWEALYNSNETLPIESKLIVEEATQLVKGLYSGWGDRVIEVSYTEPDTVALALMEQNAIEFAMSKTEARRIVGENLFKDKEKLKLNSFSEFKKIASQKTKNFNANWLRTEYNLAVATGQTSAAYFRAVSEKQHIQYVKYLTVGDSNVRNSHQLLDGKIFKINEASKVWPPNDYGCRCTMEQYPHEPNKTDLMLGNEGVKILGNKYKASDFAINRATEKVIYTPGQFYAKIDSLKKRINNITFKDFGLKSYNDIKASKKEFKYDMSINKDNVNELFIKSKDGNFMEFSDYMNRKLALPYNVFTEHIKGKYWNKEEYRPQMFPGIEKVLNTPDEVWLNTYRQKPQLCFIKFYNNIAFIIDAQLTSDGYKITTWHKLKDKDKNVRKGIKIK